MCLVDAFATILLSVPGNTVDYDDEVILSGHPPSLGWPLVPSPRRSVIRRLIVLLLVIAAVLAAWPVAAAPSSSSPGRVRQLERVALDLAVRLRAVPLRDGDFADPGRYCPPDRLAVSWVPPGPAYRFGAYIPPLGPAPGPATTSVNGVVVCRGATYAYMGFEARWTAAGWRVADVPAVDEPAGPPAPSGSKGPTAAVPQAAALPPAGAGPLDDLAPYQPQTTCSPSPKPGVDGFRRIVLTSFPGTPSYGISRDCSIGGRSEHKEGRAWDWGVAATDPGGRAAAGAVLRWLFRAEPTGRRWAMARRLGVMYIIYNRRIWASYRAEEGWRPYVGASPHTDHIHFSFSWAGARKQTSYWDGTPVTYTQGDR
jgi:hypothetical protein